MKLLRYGPAGAKRPGLLDAHGAIRDLSGFVTDIDPATLTPSALARLAALAADDLPKIEGQPRLGVPIALEEISAMIAWIASEERSFSTGAFDLSGGRATY